MSEEEQNLSRRERRAQAKKGAAGADGGGDVKDRNQKLRADAAARRRKARQSERDSAVAEGLDATERMDDALVRGSAATGQFLRNNFVWLQWVVIAGLVGAMGYLIFTYRQNLERQKKGSIVASVLETEFGRLAVADPPPQPDPRLVDPRKEFASEAERAEAAAESWKKLKGVSPDLTLFGLLGTAASLYDAEKYPEARSAYESALNNPRIGLSPELKGRALEGIALTWEAEENYPEALKAYEKLKSVKAPEFEKLVVFHIARVEYLSGNKAKAIELLTKLDTELSKDAGPEGPQDYVGAAVRDLLKTADPARAKKEREAIQAAQQQRWMEQIMEMQKQRGQNGMPQLPSIPSPSPAPEAPAPAPSGSEGDSGSASESKPSETPEPAPSSAPASPGTAPKKEGPSPAPKPPAAPKPSTNAPKPAAPAPVAPPAAAPAVPVPAAPAAPEQP